MKSPIAEPTVTTPEHLHSGGLPALANYLFEAERREPHADDRISGLRGLLSDDEERRLEESGVSKDALINDTCTRGELLGAGFVFVNRVGNGEKPIFSGKIPLADRDGEELDLDQKTLLTREELDAVYAHQQHVRPELYGLQGRDLDEVRADMASFFCAAASPPLFTMGIGELRSDVGARIVGRKGGEALADQKDLLNFWDKYADKWRKRNADRLTAARIMPHDVEADANSGFLRDYCKDLVDAHAPDGTFAGFGVEHRARGVPIELMGGVRQARKDLRPSPFLESGGVIVLSPDFALRHHGFRMNWVTIHLAGAHPNYPGLSEMGGSGDQQYMPTGTYVERFFIDDPHARGEAQKLEMAMASPTTDKASVVDEVISRLRQAVHDKREHRRQKVRRVFRLGLRSH